MACTTCPLRNRDTYVPNTGGKKARIIILGEAPGRNEVKQGTPFVGKSGELLGNMLHLHKLDNPSNIILANSIKCWVNNKDTKEVSGSIKACREYFLDLVNKVKPKLIITLGAVALRQALKKQKLMSNRGRFFYSEELKCDVFVTVHPAYLLRTCQSDYPNIQLDQMSMVEKMYYNDFQMVRDYLSNNYKKVDFKTDEYIKVNNVSDLAPIMKKRVAAIDFETRNLSMVTNDALSVSFSCTTNMTPSKPGGVFWEDDQVSTLHKSNVYLYKRNTNPEMLKRIFQNKNIVKVVANRPFDENVARLILKTPITGPVVDVLTMAHVLDENYHSYSLESVANARSGLKNIKDLRADKLPVDMTEEELVRYNGVDTDATLQSFHTMRDLLNREPKLKRYYSKFIQPVQDALASSSIHGCKIDTDKLRENEQRALDLMQDLRSKALRLIPASIKVKYRDDLKITRPALLTDYLFTHKDGLKLRPNMRTEKTGAPSLTNDHLKTFSNIRFLEHFGSFKKVNKIYNTYIKNLWDLIESNGRIYPNTLLYRTVTGRTVILNPPIQTYPQRGEFANLLREAIVSDPGWSLMARDLDQSEMKIMGWQANDKNILKALNQGIDLHTFTGAYVLYRVPPNKITKEMRASAKTANFGLVYGMSPYGFYMFAKSLGQNYSEREAESIHTRFFAKPDGYYGLPRYYTKVINEARSKGYVEGVLGRKRRLVNIRSKDDRLRKEAERQAVNFAIQNFSSDLGLVGYKLFQDEINTNKKLKNKARLLWFIHDCNMGQAKDSVLPYAMDVLKDCMENRSKQYIWENFGVDVAYPITSSGKVGPSWASLEKM